MTRRGMTLVEMLVALTASLVMMAAIAQVFSALGSAISTSRSVLDVDAQMRSVAWRLRSDLAGATARMLPPLSPEAGEGYFEVIEGPAKDADAADGTAVGPADHDDVLLFTTRSMDTPFVGQSPSGVFESTVAEVAWFARQTPGTSNPSTYTLYRRQMLVMGYVGSGTFAANNTNTLAWTGSWSGYFNQPCDVSVRRENNVLYPNTLSDLTRRESRFLHNLTGTVSAAFFPFAFVNHQTASISGTTETLPAAVNGLIFDSASPRQGEDAVLTNLIAFDVRVFDPATPASVTANGTPLVPGDDINMDGVVNATDTTSWGSLTPDASGAYVDLGNGVTSNGLLSGVNVSPHFGGYGQARSRLNGSASTPRTYDTWSTHYEANGRDEDLAAPLSDTYGIDQGTNGKDDNSDGQIDEPPYDANGDGDYLDAGEAGELETSPPYPYPLRGIEVRIRCYEPSSRQVRQITVRQTFVPQ
jgi:prepilin-type N-terminal cleavage/methylation domain-containing protein